MDMTIREFRERADTGRVFSVGFLKRTTKEREERSMLCRRGVKKGLHGGSLGFDPEERHLLTVYDMRKQAPRMVNLEALLWLNMDGRRYVWRDGAWRERP